MTIRHGFKNHIRGKIGFASDSRFWTNFTSVLGLFGERIGLRFPIQPAGLVRFFKSCYNIASDFHRCTNLVSLAIKEKVKVYKHNNNNNNNNNNNKIILDPCSKLLVVGKKIILVMSPNKNQ